MMCSYNLLYLVLELNHRILYSRRNTNGVIQWKSPWSRRPGESEELRCFARSGRDPGDVGSREVDQFEPEIDTRAQMFFVVF